MNKWKRLLRSLWLYWLFVVPNNEAFVAKRQQQRPQAVAVQSSLADAKSRRTVLAAAAWSDPSAALERTKKQLARLQSQNPRGRNDPLSTPARSDADDELDPLGTERERLYAMYAQQPANALKDECQRRRIPRRGSKPDLARRLARHDLQLKYGAVDVKEELSVDEPPLLSSPNLASKADAASASMGDATRSSDVLHDPRDETSLRRSVLTRFGSMSLSPAASEAMTRAGFTQPSPIQAQALGPLSRGQSAILHAETGSGKTLTYLLPLTERLWKPQSTGLAVILTPTRELAAQVAGVAQVLSPPGSVRLITHPTHLAKPERGNPNANAPHSTARIFVSSARTMEQSLFGGSNMPAPPTPKPLALQFLQQVRYLVLDEVDRLLLSASAKKSSGPTTSSSRHRHAHERPAAVVTAAIARHSLGKAQVVVASATVGRALRRELARVLGLTPAECPPVLRGEDEVAAEATATTTTTRAVTIPDSVQHYIYLADDASPGNILTSAYRVVQKLGSHRKILLVLTRGFGISTANAVGALQHFQCQPPPVSLLDALQTRVDELDKTGSESLIEQHRQVSRVAAGIGESVADPPPAVDAKQEGYLLVTGEDTVRGLHLDGLDVVLVAGRPQGVDEYTHIAGRTGRAGNLGRVINIVDNAASLRSWEKMLLCEFQELSLDDVAGWN